MFNRMVSWARQYDQKTVAKIIIVAVLLLAFIVAMVVVEGVNADQPARKGAENSNSGKPPAHSNAGGRRDEARNDPDDNGSGPDRGDGGWDTEDWNHGCGNEPSGDRDDDNEGWCGRPKPAPTPNPTEPPTGGVEPIPTPTPKPTETCKAVFYGWTPEVFASGIDVHNPANELVKIAEAHGYLEIVFARGFMGTVLWYQEATGHHSIAQGFVCSEAHMVFVEPLLLGDLME